MGIKKNSNELGRKYILFNHIIFHTYRYIYTQIKRALQTL